MKQPKADELLDWKSQQVPQEDRDEFVDGVLTPSNLRRVFWTILCFLPLSTIFLIENLFEGGDSKLVALGMLDLGLSVSFLVATRYCLVRQDTIKWRRRLVIAYYAFCLISTILYDFLAYSSVGEAPIYVVGVILPAVLFHIPARQAYGMLAVVHAVYTFLLVNGGRPPQEFVGVWITGTFGIILACLAASYLFSREWKNYQQFKIIQGNNRELTTLNEELQRQKKEMNDIMALAAHDLRSPLHSMQGLFEVLEAKDEWKNPPYTEVLQLLQDNCSGQLALLNSLLDSYRAEHGQSDLRRERIDLIEIITEVQAKFTDQGATIKLQTEELTASTVSDPIALRQILENLLSNATKFSPPKTAIRISLSRHTDTWTIGVTDKGPGIPENERVRLFHKFFRTSAVKSAQQGAGLGLFIASQLTRNLGGEISYKAEKPHGSIFTLRLPATETR
jgi:signal transduction histidine kinase